MIAAEQAVWTRAARQPGGRPGFIAGRRLLADAKETCRAS
jgi:hypothetical protein